MQRDAKEYDRLRAKFAQGIVPDLQTVNLAVLFEPFWAALFSEKVEERAEGAHGLLKYRALMERGTFGGGAPSGDDLEGLTPEERAAVESV